MADRVSFAEFAKRAGVARSAITQACVKGDKPLAPAISGDKRIDTGHPAAIAYLEKHAAAKAEKEELRRIEKLAEPEEAPLPQYPDEYEDFLDVPLSVLLDKFSTDTRFKVWLDAAEKSEKLRALRLKNDVAEDTYIRRDFVEDVVFNLINRGYARVLNDSPKAIASKVRELIAKGKPDQELIEEVKKELSVHLKKAKRDVTKGLKNG